jgi:hypothetical protein
MLRAIVLAKKKNDRVDARKICDSLRCDFLPECYMAPSPIRERRRILLAARTVSKIIVVAVAQWLHKSSQTGLTCTEVGRLIRM